jgi:hypothetical protein
MHVDLPKPLHGWRAFVGEVGVIVLGVLIALGAQQLVESLNWREKVDAAVSDMNNELGSGDGPEAYERLAIHDCVATHLNGLRALVSTAIARRAGSSSIGSGSQIALGTRLPAMPQTLRMWRRTCRTSRCSSTALPTK